MNKVINEDIMKSCSLRKAGGEKLKLKTAIIAVSISAIVVISALVINFEISDSSGGTTRTLPSTNSTSINQPFETLVGNLSNPHPYYNSSYGYVTPNLWNLKEGNGNVIMSIYSNSSIHTIASLTNVTTNVHTIVGYPSEHFIYSIGEPVTSLINDNLSSFVSFQIGNYTQELPVDIAYDIFLGHNNVNLSVEIMIFLYWSSNNYPSAAYVGSVTIPTIINGHSQNVTWDVLENAEGTSGGWPLFIFIPSITLQNSMSYTINIATFLSYLEKNSYIPPSYIMVRLGIGSEFGSIYSPTESYSFWMYTYFILDGTKYQVIQPPPEVN